MTGDAQVHIDQAWDAVRERPRAAFAVIAGGALLIGFWGGQWYAQRTARRRSAALRRHLKENGVCDSGLSTPRFSVSGETPRYTSSGDSEDKLDFAMALVYRADLSLGKGRFATLCAQATLGQFKKLWRAKSDDLKIWERSSAVKVCLQVEDEDQLLKTEQDAREAGLPTFTVKDFQNSRRVRSVMAIGPAENSRIQSVTQNLKLLH